MYPIVRCSENVFIVAVPPEEYHNFICQYVLNNCPENTELCFYNRNAFLNCRKALDHFVCESGSFNNSTSLSFIPNGKKSILTHQALYKTLMYKFKEDMFICTVILKSQNCQQILIKPEDNLEMFILDNLHLKQFYGFLSSTRKKVVARNLYNLTQKSHQ